MEEVWVVTAWQTVQWMRAPATTDTVHDFKPFQCDYKVETVRGKYLSNAENIFVLGPAAALRQAEGVQPVAQERSALHADLSGADVYLSKYLHIYIYISISTYLNILSISVISAGVS